MIHGIILVMNQSNMIAFSFLQHKWHLNEAKWSNIAKFLAFDNINVLYNRSQKAQSLTVMKVDQHDRHACSMPSTWIIRG